MELYKFIVYGKVQGVYYRKFISQAAMREQVRGYIKNLPNGTVEAVAELIDDDIPQFLSLLKKGSPSSIVEDIQYSLTDEILIYDGFEIRA